MSVSELGGWIFSFLVGALVGALIRRQQPPETHADIHDHIGWLDRELNSGPLSHLLARHTRESIRVAYGLRTDSSRPHDAPVPTTAVPQVVPATRTAGRSKVAPQVVEASKARQAERLAPVTNPPKVAAHAAPQVHPAGHRKVTTPVVPAAMATAAHASSGQLRDIIQRPVMKEKTPREPITWDPAVLLLYLGAFLVVTSGLVYASYNWADLQPWQKLGMLVAMTVAFAGGGWLLLGIPRVRQAAESFIVIGALLVPANAIAAYTVLERSDARTALILLLGSLATALLHTVFSVRPGGVIYAYGAAIASTLALGSLLPALGTGVAWAGVPVLLAAAIGPDLVHRLDNRLAHLRQPVTLVLLVGALPAYGVGLTDRADDASSWATVVSSAIATVVLARLAMRLPDTMRDLPGTFSSLTLMACVVTALDVTLPATQLFVAAGAVALLNGAYAYRLNPVLYAHIAVAAALVAIGTLAPAFGADVVWGAVTVLLVVAVAPELAARASGTYERFQAPIVMTSLLAIVPAYLLGFGDSWNGSTWWPLAVLHAATTVTLARLEMRRPVGVPGLAAIASLVATVVVVLAELDVEAIPVHVFAGAGVATVLAGMFSVRPGGPVFAFTTAVAAVVATGSLLPALGTDLAWGMLPVLLAAAVIPDLGDRGARRLAHLREPVAQVLEAAVFPAYALGMADAIDREAWWPIVAINACATIALPRMAIRRTMEIPAILGSLTLIATVVATLGALGIENQSVWVATAIATAFGLIALGQAVSPWTSLPVARLVLHLEAMAGFALATGLAVLEDDWRTPVVLGSSVVGIALIAWFRRERWWLFLSGLWFDGFWYSLPGFETVQSWDLATQARYGIPLPLLLAAVALVLSRRSSRRSSPHRARWDLPVWTAAGLTALAVTVHPFSRWAEPSDNVLGTVAIGCALFAIGALVAARALDGHRLARLAYGGWAAAAILATAAILPGHRADAAIGALVMATAVGMLSLPMIPVFLGPLRPLAPYWRGGRGRPEELVPIVVVGATALLTMLGYTVTYITTVESDPSLDLPGIRWTWLTYLAIWMAGAAGMALAGDRLGRRAVSPFLRTLPFGVFGLGGVALLLLLRMLTTDLVAWTLAGIGVALVLHAVASLTGNTGNPFRNELREFAIRTSTGLGTVSVASNLALAIPEPERAHDGLQAVAFGVTGIALLAIAARVGNPIRIHAGLAALGIAVSYMARVMTSEVGAIPMTQIAFAWLVMGTSLALPPALRWMGPAVRQSAIGLGVFTIANALWLNQPIDVSDSLWGTVLAALVSMAGLLAVHAWVRQDRLEGLAASAVAMVALLLQIQRGEPDNLQMYTVPVAVYLLALGVIHRRSARVRDILLAMGSGLLLVPPLIEAQGESDVQQLLVAGIEALVLFVIGVFLRLRVLVAAGVATMSLIALRFLVDAAIALPGWISLLAGGLLLLLIGTILTVWKEELRARLDRLQAGWHEMG